MTDWVIEVTVPASEARGADVIAPVGVSSPAAACLGCTVEGGQSRRWIEPGSCQDILIVVPHGDEVLFRYRFHTEPGQYPEALFKPAPSRHTRAATALVEDAQRLAGAAGNMDRALRLGRAVAEKFTYGHPETRFTDGLDHVPHLACGLTEGSCVDIHTYFVASLRAAGIEAGYLTGYVFPEDGPASAHCWVVTRIDGLTQEWDISHFLQMGRRDIIPALNPKGGFRLPVGHSMGLVLPGSGEDDLKLLSEPMALMPDGPARFSNRRITLHTYQRAKAKA